MEAVAPVIVTSQNRLDAAVREAVERGVRNALAQLQSAEEERPGFGWVDNDTAMRLLNLSRPTLARYRADGTLPYSKLGSSVYYRVDAIEAVLEARTVERETT
jgi:predicted DNA-binding transcriptional regulator AlpA